MEQAEMLQKMIDAGVHLGHRKSKGHPKMKPYLFGIRQNVQIINVEKTLQKMQEAAAFLKEVAGRNGTILFVSTKMPAKPFTKEFAQRLSIPYVSERWLGGTLTNFPVISKRLEYFLSQEAQKAKGELEKYTKKEQLMIDRELEDLEKKMGGLKTLKQLPNALIMVDIEEHSTALREAIRMGVPTVAITDTNTDPTLVNFPIPANDKSGKSVRFILDYLAAAIEEGKSEFIKS